MENQLSVRRGRRQCARCAAPGFQLRDQFGARVDPRIGDDPQAAIKLRGLLLQTSPVLDLQQSVPKPYGTITPDFLRVRTTESQEMGQMLQQPGIDGSAIQIHNSNKAAHYGTREDGSYIVS